MERRLTAIFAADVASHRQLSDRIARYHRPQQQHRSSQDFGDAFMANDQHVAMLKKGVDAWNAWRGENPDVVPDLSGGEPDIKEG